MQEVLGEARKNIKEHTLLRLCHNSKLQQHNFAVETAYEIPTQNPFCPFLPSCCGLCEARRRRRRFSRRCGCIGSSGCECVCMCKCVERQRNRFAKSKLDKNNRENKGNNNKEEGVCQKEDDGRREKTIEPLPDGKSWIPQNCTRSRVLDLRL